MSTINKNYETFTKHENVAHTNNQKQAIETTFEGVQMFNLADNDFEKL